MYLEAARCSTPGVTVRPSSRASKTSWIVGAPLRRSKSPPLERRGRGSASVPDLRHGVVRRAETRMNWDRVHREDRASRYGTEPVWHGLSGSTGGKKKKKKRNTSSSDGQPGARANRAASRKAGTTGAPVDQATRARHHATGNRIRPTATGDSCHDEGMDADRSCGRPAEPTRHHHETTRLPWTHRTFSLASRRDRTCMRFRQTGFDADLVRSGGGNTRRDVVARADLPAKRAAL
jgi:hypothetical protein